MDKIWLVLNTKEENFVINVCTSKEKAEELAAQYKYNFQEVELLTDVDYICIEEVELNKPVAWDCYGEY